MALTVPKASDKVWQGPSAETIICGWNAVMARFRAHPRSIVRAYVEKSRLEHGGAVLRALAARRCAYHVVDSSVLEKVTGTIHHEGIALLVRSQPPMNVEQFLAALAERRGTHRGQATSVIVLDGVEHALNVGAIVRVAAHFGAIGVVLLSADSGPRLDSTGFFRAAAGGAEAGLLLCRAARSAATHLIAALEDRGWRAVGTTSHTEVVQGRAQPKSIHEASLPAHVAFVFGSESDGLSQGVEAKLRHWITIPGTGAVESLNVACAASVLLAAWSRQVLATGKAPRPVASATLSLGTR